MKPKCLFRGCVQPQGEFIFRPILQVEVESGRRKDGRSLKNNKTTVKTQQNACCPDTNVLHSLGSNANMLFIYGRFYCSSCFPFNRNVLCRNLLLPCEANISRTLSSAVGLKTRPGLSNQAQHATTPAWLVRVKHPNTPVSHHLGVVRFRSLGACWCCSDGEQQHLTRQDTQES